MDFSPLFHPRGIAIVGASADLTRIGGHPIRALRQAGYKGGIYPVNPKYPEMHGLKCYPQVAAIDGPCDLAVVAVPASGVPAAIRDCGKAGVRFAVVLTAGFKETATDEGRRLEADLKRAIAETGVRVIGPNCQGVVSIEERVFAVFGSVSSELDLKAGEVSCAFQSGGFGYAVVNLAELQGVGFRYCVSSGNETDVTMPELLGAFLDDPGTKLAFAYMEGTPDARRLLELGRKSLETGKPVLIWKAANTDAGAKAAASHTANMTGSYDLYRAAFRQSGLIEAFDVEPIVDVAKMVAQGRLPKGRSIGVLSISGGSGIVFADRAVREGMTLPSFTPQTIKDLREVVPSFGSVENPADITAGIFNDMSIFTRTLDIVLKDPGIDQLAILLASITGPGAELAVEAICAAAAKTDKPVSLAWSGRKDKAPRGFKMLEEARVPHILTPVRLAQAAAVLARFADDRQRLLPRRAPQVKVGSGPDLPAGAATLSEAESKAVLAGYGIPVTREVLVADARQAAEAARALKAPYAVKVVSRDIAHKTEAGAVRLGLADAPAVEAAAVDVLANARCAVPDAKIDGVLVAEMAHGIEVLIGVVNDEAFGPTVAVGLGGVLTEVLRDLTYRIAPFGVEEARDMIAELKGAKLFAGYRGAPAGDTEALARVLSDVSTMAVALGDRLKELDINPVFVGPPGQGVVAADALLVLKESGAGRSS